MSVKVWQCYRCNLTFKDEGLAKLHEELSRHSVKTVKTAEI
ncbi:MAG: hypothetical protein ACRD91_04120 [Nitrosopumilaceae archaeon]